MVHLKRTDPMDPGFHGLVRKLDLELQERYGQDQSFFDQFNKIDTSGRVVLASQDDVLIGCGVFKLYEGSVCEIKRMYVDPVFRGRRVAGALLAELEAWAEEENFTECILETGKLQPEAIRAYENAGYIQIPNYGQYVGVELSICMKKNLRNTKT